MRLRTALSAAAVISICLAPVWGSTASAYIDASGQAVRGPTVLPQHRSSSPPLRSDSHNAAWQIGPYGSPPGTRYRPDANPAAVATHGPARFTVLTPTLVRMEWSPHTPPVWHDSGSFTVVHRWFDMVPQFKATVGEDGSFTLETESVTIVYNPSAAHPAAGFTSATLHARVHSTGAEWAPGTPASGSLHGTIRTLDRIGRPLDIGCVAPAYRNDTHCEEGEHGNGYSLLGARVRAHVYACASWV